MHAFLGPLAANSQSAHDKYSTACGLAACLIPANWPGIGGVRERLSDDR